MEELRYQVDLLNAMNKQIQAEAKMYQLICDTSSDAIVYVDLLKNRVKTIGSFERFFGEVSLKSSSDLAKLYSFVGEQSVLLFRELLFLENTKKDFDSQTLHMFDGKKYMECRVNVIYDSRNIPTDKIIRFSDVTKNKSQNDELVYMAYYDILTNLYNRNYFVRLLSEYIRRAEEENGIVSVMFLDLDNFHTINDGMGLEVGDEIVQQFGLKLKEFEQENVLISHFNSDTYCVAIYEPSKDRNVDYIFKHLKEDLKNPIKLSNGSEVLVSFCAGVAEYPEASTKTLELINCSEIVMFKAKKKGRGAIEYFDSLILEEFLNNADIENKLKKAVFSENFSVNFQPQFKVNDKSLRGVEALIRWKDEEGKWISPAVFIPISEKNGTILPIGAFVMEESIKQFSIWKTNYSRDFVLSINISSIQYREEDFVNRLIGLLRKYSVEPSDIELEITESVLISDFKETIEKLTVLRAYGIKISLDDFGTGFSSLSYLKGLPVDTIKIDKSFVDAIETDENARVIFETIVYMSKKLGLETIAEGVENSHQADLVKAIGCDCIQGFLLGKPMSAKGIDSLLLESI